MIRIHLVQDICLDIYCLVINEPDSYFEFLNCPTEEWIDPIEIFQKELPYAERGNFTFGISRFWLHINHPDYLHKYHKEIP